MFTLWPSPTSFQYRHFMDLDMQFPFRSSYTIPFIFLVLLLLFAWIPMLWYTPAYTQSHTCTLKLLHKIVFGQTLHTLPGLDMYGECVSVTIPSQDRFRELTNFIVLGTVHSIDGPINQFRIISMTIMLRSFNWLAVCMAGMRVFVRNGKVEI